MAYNLNYGYPYFSYVLSGVLIVFVIAIPVLTMRSFAEERKSRTDQMLLTAPVSLFQVVIGKLKYLVSRSNPHGVVAGAEANGRVGPIQGRGLVCRQRPGAGPEHRQANRQQQGGGPQPSAFFGETNGTHKGHSSLVMPGFD